MGTKRFEIGTEHNGNFVPDTIGNDPFLTTFPTLDEAIAAMQDVIKHAVQMWGEPMTDGAINDSDRNRIVWHQIDGAL